MFTIPANQIPIIQAASDTHKYPYNLLSSQGYQESGLNPAAHSGNTNGSIDRGWAEINNVAHPEVTDAEAFNLDFAVNWMAQYMRSLYDQHGSWYLALLAYNGGEGAVIAYNEGRPYNQHYADNIFALAGMNAIWPKCQEIATLCGLLYVLSSSAEDKQFYHAMANGIRARMGWAETLPINEITIY